MRRYSYVVSVSFVVESDTAGDPTPDEIISTLKNKIDRGGWQWIGKCAEIVDVTDNESLDMPEPESIEEPL